MGSFYFSFCSKTFYSCFQFHVSRKTVKICQVNIPGYKLVNMYISLDWFKGKSTGNHGFYHQI